MTTPTPDAKDELFAAMLHQADLLREESGCAYGQFAADLMAATLVHARNAGSLTEDMVHQDLSACLSAFGVRVAADPASVHAGLRGAAQ